MRGTWLIWQRELVGSFQSPVAYVTMAVYLLLAGWTFLRGVENRLGTQETPEVLLFAAVFIWMPLFVTAITMRLFAEEKRSGTIETLMTAPVSDVQVVAGKFLGALSFFVLAAVPAVGVLFVPAAVGHAQGFVDAGSLAGGCLVLLLISAFCVAIGLFVSLLTRNQIVAAVCCFATICLPFVVRVTAAKLPLFSDSVIEALSAETHIVDFARGSVDTRPLVLYLSGTWLLLFAAVKVLETRRWR